MATERAGSLLGASASVGDVQMLKVMSFVLGAPCDHVEQYQRAMVCAAGAGQEDIIRSLIQMGVVPLDNIALQCAQREGYSNIVEILKSISV